MSRVHRTPPSQRRVIVEIGLASIVVGALGGLAWWLLAGDVTVEVIENGVALTVEQGRLLFGHEAVFSSIAAGAGLLLAGFFAVRHAHAPVTTILTLVAGGGAGAFVMLTAGRLLGSGPIDERAADAAVGTHLTVPLELEAWAALVVWPLVVAVVAAIVSIVRDDRTAWGTSGGGAVWAPPEHLGDDSASEGAAGAGGVADADRPDGSLSQGARSWPSSPP